MSLRLECKFGIFWPGFFSANIGTETSYSNHGHETFSPRRPSISAKALGISLNCNQLKNPLCWEFYLHLLDLVLFASANAWWLGVVLTGEWFQWYSLVDFWLIKFAIRSHFFMAMQSNQIRQWKFDLAGACASTCGTESPGSFVKQLQYHLGMMFNTSFWQYKGMGYSGYGIGFIKSS